MKHLLFVAVAAGSFSGITISVKAQANVNIERFAVKATSKVSPRFIEGIEVTTGVVPDTMTVAVENTFPFSSPATKVSFAKPAFNGVIELCSPLQFKYAMMTEQEVESITNFKLYSFIEGWWATRYQYGGTGRSGIDCSAFTGKLLQDVYGLTVPRIAKDQYEMSEKIATENLTEGDLVFFDTRGGVSHVGLYLGNNYFVHSSVHSGVTISSLADDYYSRKFISGGRVPPSPKGELSGDPKVNGIEINPAL